MKYEGTVCMAWTHLQPAEPTTLGYRFANYAQDLLDRHRASRDRPRPVPEGQGHEGRGRDLGELREAARRKGKARERSSRGSWTRSVWTISTVSTQTYPRKVDYILLSLSRLDSRVLPQVRSRPPRPPVADVRRAVGADGGAAGRARARCRSRRTRSPQRGCARWRGWSPRSLRSRSRTRPTASSRGPSTTRPTAA